MIPQTLSQARMILNGFLYQVFRNLSVHERNLILLIMRCKTKHQLNRKQYFIHEYKHIMGRITS